MERDAIFFLRPVLLDVSTLPSKISSFCFVTSLSTGHLFFGTSYFSSCARKQPFGSALFKSSAVNIFAHCDIEELQSTYRVSRV